MVYHREGVGEMKVAHKILIRKYEVKKKVSHVLFKYISLGVRFI
jgi:hypothetical protein